MSSKRLSLNEKKRIVELYKDGLSMNKIGVELGIHPSTVKSNLIREGVLEKPKVSNKSKPKTSKKSKGTKTKSEKLKQPKSTVKKEAKFKTYTKEEKIKYCNKKYGVGNWEFIDKETFIELMLDIQEYRSFTKAGI